jgi:hypothetical protein
MFVIGNCLNKDNILLVDKEGFSISSSMLLKKRLDSIFKFIPVFGTVNCKDEGIFYVQSNELVQDNGYLRKQGITFCIVSDKFIQEEIDLKDFGKVYIGTIEGLHDRVVYFVDYDYAYLIKNEDIDVVLNCLKTRNAEAPKQYMGLLKTLKLLKELDISK